MDPNEDDSGTVDDIDMPVKKVRYSCETQTTTKPFVCAGSSNESSGNTDSTTSATKRISPMDQLMSAAEEAFDFDLPLEIFEKRNDLAAEVQLPLGDVDNEDYFLLRWQARQLAKGSVDNAINTVMEQWKAVIKPTDISCCNSLIEHEGILMAIHSHGLTEAHNNSNTATVNVINGGIENRVNSQERIDDTDFLNTAVSAAISSKGLSPSCSYK